MIRTDDVGTASECIAGSDPILSAESALESMGCLCCHGQVVSLESVVCRPCRQALRTGRGFAISLTDCDAPLPRNYADGIRDGDTAGRASPIFPCFRFLAEFTQLSILLGKARM